MRSRFVSRCVWTMSLLSNRGRSEPGLCSWLHLAQWTLPPECRKRSIRLNVAQRSIGISRPLETFLSRPQLAALFMRRQARPAPPSPTFCSLADIPPRAEHRHWERHSTFPNFRLSNCIAMKTPIRSATNVAPLQTACNGSPNSATAT